MYMKNLTSILFGCGILWSTTILIAQNPSNKWTSLPMYGGGYVTDIVPHATNLNTLVAVTDVSGLFQTTDGGSNWTSLTANIPKKDNKYFRCRSFAFEPTTTTTLNSRTMYYISEGDKVPGIFWKTVDGGANWTSTVLDLTVSGNGYARYAGATILVNPNNVQQIFIGGQANATQNGGLAISTNKGSSWQYLRTFDLGKAWITKLKFDPAHPNLIYIAASKNPDISTSIGGFWKYDLSATSNPLTKISNQDIVDFDFDANQTTIISTSQSTVYKSIDGGIKWQQLTVPNLKYGLFAVAHPSDSGSWYFATQGDFDQNAIVTTSNYGNSWTLVRYNFTTYRKNADKLSYPNLPNNYKPQFGNNLSCLLFRGNSAYVGDWYGVWKTGNANLPLVKTTTDIADNSNWSWAFSVIGIHNMVQLRTSLHPTDSTQFFANLADISCYQSTNSGATMIHRPIAKVNSTTKIAFHKNQPAIGYLVGTQGEGEGVGKGGRIRKTTTNGGTWDSISTLTESYFENLSKSITDLVLTPKKDTLIVGLVPKAANDVQIYISKNGGTQWAAWVENLPALDTFFEVWGKNDHLLSDADGQTFYVWNAKGLYRRNPLEAQWTKSAFSNINESGKVESVVAHPANPKTLYVTFGSNKVYKSVTRGNGDWTALSALPTGEQAELLAVSKSGRIVVQTRNANGQGLFLSNNHGVTWKTVALTGFLRQVEGLVFLQEKKLLGWTGGNSGFISDISSLLEKEVRSEMLSKLTVFPNPTTHTVTVELPEEALIATVFDATGRFIFSLEAIPSDSFLQLDVNGLQTGLYFVRVGTNVASFVKN
ncbi:MAG: hypothetical protein RLZZ628_2197 [Bacteroidota bacterium]|jgi:photosystem II stability/assembly factor-like uncharacterized protein